ncbi:MAG: hypothetical protein NTY05_07000 [Rhodocyclales bacterium]|nr:hypothetical protein [Rhodocyclales bacterium]
MGLTTSGATIIALVAMVLWLFNHVYQGIHHDGVLYALLAAHWMDPLPYARELFFLSGSQDDFSFFSPLYGTLISWGGLNAAAQAVVLGGAALWVLACLALARSMFGPVWLVTLAVLYCATINFSYSPNFGTFRFNENFATARSLAVPIALLALAAMVSGRRLVAVVLGAVSIAFHPLMGIWVVLLAAAKSLPERWLVASVIVLLVMLFGGSVASPFESLQILDQEWSETARASTPNDIFLGGWGVLRLSDILLTVGILWLAGRVGSPGQRELLLRLCLLTVVAIFVAQLCSYFWPIRLVIQVQPWRVLWLAELMAIFALVDLLGAASVAGRRYLFVTLGVVAVAWGVPAVRPLIPFLALLLLSTDSLTRWLVGGIDKLSARPVLAGSLGIGLVLLLLPGYWISLELLGPTVLGNQLPDFAAVKGFLVAGGEGLFFLMLGLGMQYRAGRWIIVGAALPSLLLAASLWDVRGSALRQLEDDYLSAHPASWINGLPVRHGDVVAWPERQLETWLVLRTPVYATTWQAIGIVFSRPRMVEVKRRLERASISILPDQIDMSDRDLAIGEVHRNLVVAGHDIRNLHRYGQGFATSAGVAYLCEDKVLDWVISRQPKAGSVSGLRFDPGAAYGGIQYLFDCRDFRKPGLVRG